MYRLDCSKVSTAKDYERMSVEELERAVTHLSPEELSAFSAWFRGYMERDWQEWDKQIEEDYEAGKLDDLIEKAGEDIDAGRTRPL